MLLSLIILLAYPRTVYRDFKMDAADDSNGWFSTQEMAETIGAMHAKITLMENCQSWYSGNMTFPSIDPDPDKSWCISKKNGRDQTLWMCGATAYGECQVAFEGIDEDD